MTAQTDKVEFFHLSELPTNITANFTTANSCVSRHFNNKFAVMCEAFWVKVSLYTFKKIFTNTLSY